MDAMLELAKRHGLVVIEDTAQAIGATYKGRPAGTIADAGTFSFVETKNMVTGEGGMVVTNQEHVAHGCRLVRNHGECYVDGAPRSYAARILGWNYRMTELEAAIGIAQLKQLSGWTDQRIANGAYLNARLRFPGLTTPCQDAKVQHVYHLYSLLYDEDVVGVPRPLFQRALVAEGIPWTLGYPHPLYRNPLFQERAAYRNLLLPVAEDLCRRSLWTNVVRAPATIEDMEDVVRAMEKVYEGRQQLRELANEARESAVT
jgi:dTDP-4-amino-4,6-dideoxygalactose transaminase